MVTTTSTIPDIRESTYSPVVASASDITAWTTITLPTNALVVQTSGFYTGLFGYDMSKFFTYCQTATTGCDYTTYNVNYFDGWSIGAYIAVTADSGAYDQESLGVGLCFEDTSACLGFGTDFDGVLNSGWNGLMFNWYDFSSSTPDVLSAA